MKIALINLIKGEYHEKIKALMILINKKLYLNKMQMIEFVLFTLNLHDKSDFSINENNNNNNIYQFQNYFGEIKDLEQSIIAEELVNEIYFTQNLTSADLLSVKAIMEYFTSKYFNKLEFLSSLCKN